MKQNYSVYLVTDRTIAGERNLADIVMAAVSGGVSCVQLREKNLPTRQFVEEARRLVAHLRSLGVPLIVNDRVDVAQACDADGVHLGQNDMHIRDARSLLGAGKIIGISAESLEDAVQAEQEGADYIGISPVFSTTTKADIAEPLGLAGVRSIRQNVQLPLVGIGGISADNAADVVQHGADGVAVVSAIVAAECPETSARKLLQQVEQAKGKG
mgnify:CR=1 FL=1